MPSRRWKIPISPPWHGPAGWRDTASSAAAIAHKLKLCDAETLTEVGTELGSG